MEGSFEFALLRVGVVVVSLFYSSVVVVLYFMHALFGWWMWLAAGVVLFAAGAVMLSDLRKRRTCDMCEHGASHTKVRVDRVYGSFRAFYCPAHKGADVKYTIEAWRGRGRSQLARAFAVTAITCAAFHAADIYGVPLPESLRSCQRQL